MSQPLFSVVTITLNCVTDAVMTARSVLNQGYDNFEYIIKDGGSKDDTVQQLRQIGVRNITIAPDSGIYDAMNQALVMCSGQYVYFLNAGDTFYSTDTLRLLAARLDPEAVIIYGNLNLYPYGRISRQPARLSRYYLFRKNINHQAWMARTEVYKAFNLFNLAYHYVADQEFLWRVVLEHHLPVQYIDITFATFVYGGASTRKSAQAQVRQERWRLLYQYYSSWEIYIYAIASLYFLNPLKAWIWDILYPIQTHR